MKSAILTKSIVFVFMVLLVLGTALNVNAQRRGHMMGWQQDRPVEDDWGGYGPAMRGYGPGMMGGGYGMMGPGYGMMGGGYGMMGGPGMMGFGMGMGHGMGPAMGMMGPFMAGCLYQLDLTENQQDEILSLQRQARREQMETMLDIMDIRDKLIEEMAEDRPDPAKVRELQEAMSKKQAEMMENSVKNRNRIYDMLSGDQRKQLRESQSRPYYRPYDTDQNRP
ncbi:MAG: Spy/CpxP family protein refolding chaperone [Desulfobacteraceae bacterium]|nr:Spy/CpxP family protein refolding chaperone [Desulfobacteraceae bacterium]